MSKRKTTSLGEICTDISYGYTESASSEIVGPKFLRITDIQHDFITWSNVPFCPISPENHRKYKLENGDIVIARTGASTGATAIFKDENIDAVFASYLIRYKVDKKVADPFYIGYILRSTYWKSYVASIIGGSAQPGANAKQFAAFEFQLPDLHTQCQIAQFLSSLDNKIELNLQMNQTLEAMAQAIFKEWFVHFNFPGFDGELVDGLPKGWRNDRFENHFDVLRGLSYKGSGLSQKDIGIPMYNLNSIYEGGGFKYEGIKFYNGEYKEKHLIRPRDIIVANTEQGHKYLLIGFPAVVPFYFGDPAIFSHHIYRLRPKENSPLTPQFMYYLLLQQDIREQIIGCSNGTTVNMLKIDGLQIPIFKMPQRELIQQFSDIVEPIWQRQENNIRENESLTQIRDTLLPKLMSGQLEVPYA